MKHLEAPPTSFRADPGQSPGERPESRAVVEHRLDSGGRLRRLRNDGGADSGCTLRAFQRCVLAFLVLCAVPAPAADTPPAAAVASAHPLATEAGIEILKKGGNAFDAAVAVSAALGVVEPYSSGIGGGGFWLLHRASDGKQVMVDGRETAPAAAHRRMYLDQDENVIPDLSLEGPLSAGIPGLVAGLAYIAEIYGTLPLKESLEPAIRYATKGFPVTPGYQQDVTWRLEKVKKYPETAHLFLKDGAIPELGHMIVQKELGELLKNIAKYGMNHFYRGEFAQKLVAGVNAAGGTWSMEDLANYRVIERLPVVIKYHDLRVVSAPPPSSGGIVLAQALRILEHFDLEALDPFTRLHIVIETMRRAYRDRAVFLGDPGFDEIPTDRLLNEEYLDGLALSIDPNQATPSEELGDTPGFDPVGDQTTHFSVMDKEGNRVAGTLSINLPFGSCFMPPGTGVLLNDEMDDFSIKEATPNAFGLVGFDANAVQGGKRPLSSMTPTFIETEDRIGILGTPGGSRIISMVLIGILDFDRGNGPESWVRQKRFHHQYLPDEVSFEKYGLNSYEQMKLAERGHTLKEVPWNYGNMHAVMWDRKNNRVEAASDPRGEGQAEVIEVR